MIGKKGKGAKSHLPDAETDGGVDIVTGCAVYWQKCYHFVINARAIKTASHHAGVARFNLEI